MATSLETARTLLKDVRHDLLKRANVVAVGVGYKITEGKQTDELALICSVDSKKAAQFLTSKDVIPSTIQNVPTDVNPTGIIRALVDPTGRFRPAPGGVSTGHVNITAGTLGCIVKKNDKIYILSNNHVLANSNDANIGDPILQPGPYDGGQLAQDQIAQLSEFVPIEFEESGADPCGLADAVAKLLNGLAAILGSKTRLFSKRITAVENLVDCAIAEPLNPDDVKHEILEIGAINGTAEATLGMPLQKMGRTTNHTTGTVLQIDVTVRVNYGSNKNATFVDQIMAGALSQGGDSGSAVLNDHKQLVGLLYAGSDTSTIINRIQNVFHELQVTLP
jgi:hypothetical protein